MSDNLNQQLELIKKEHLIFVDEDLRKTVEYHLNELSTLIQKERTAAVMEHLNTKIKVGAIEREKEIREEAVRGFAKWLFDNGYCDSDIYDEGGLSEYLSQTKGGEDI